MRERGEAREKVSERDEECVADEGACCGECCRACPSHLFVPVAFPATGIITSPHAVPVFAVVWEEGLERGRSAERARPGDALLPRSRHEKSTCGLVAMAMHCCCARGFASIVVVVWCRTASTHCPSRKKNSLSDAALSFPSGSFPHPIYIFHHIITSHLPRY